MAPRRVEEIPLKRVAALGCKLPLRLPVGEILTDITQRQWKLGPTIGCGGFGDIYLASNETDRPVDQHAKYAIKIEPHENGPLFVEMNFYIRVARREMIKTWCKTQGKKRIGVPTYEGAGSHNYRGEKYRFLVIPRYGVDVGKLFLSNGRKLPSKLVNSLAIQMLDALEYIHSRGYAHADVKGSNILLQGNGKEKLAYLVDYGLAYRFRTSSGEHKVFVQDARRAHEGTLEFTSRDAHHGTHSRRGDLETLGYNLLQWSCSCLPWECCTNPEEIHAQKEDLMKDLPLLIKKCFFNGQKPPDAIVKYMRYISGLSFETKPNYEYLRNLFQYQDYVQNIADENLSRNGKVIEGPYLRVRRPCKPINEEIRITRNRPKLNLLEKDFSWERILSSDPDKLAKIHVRYVSCSLTPPPSPPPQPPSQTFSLPTYAMLKVLKKMKNKQSTSFAKHKFSNELKAKWMTPAMEEIVQLIKKNNCTIQTNSNNRLTRSRTRIKRLQKSPNNRQKK